MTDLLLSAPSGRCQGSRLCGRAPCFQAQLDAAAGRRPVRQHAQLCAEHLGGTVQALAAWARGQGLEGKVTVLAIDQTPRAQAPSSVRFDDWMRCGFAFGTILLSP